ncbi:MAG: nuclear transport factor 2 family protein [Acidobacteriia bacterium]|nr:nuclear transport factor 2 family protein [Terriglobia bacterium]
MKIMQIAALAACLAMPSLARAQAPDAKNSKAAQEIIEFRNKYIAAEENRDGAYMEKIFADDFYALNPQGQLLDKAHQIANLLRPERTLKLSPPTEVSVHFHGDTAIMWERVTVTGTDKGKPFGGDFRFSRVFVKDHGQWKVVLAQGAPVTAAQAEAK